MVQLHRSAELSLGSINRPVVRIYYFKLRWLLPLYCRRSAMKTIRNNSSALSHSFCFHRDKLSDWENQLISAVGKALIIAYSHNHFQNILTFKLKIKERVLYCSQTAPFSSPIPTLCSQKEKTPSSVNLCPILKPVLIYAFCALCQTIHTGEGGRISFYYESFKTFGKMPGSSAGTTKV